MPDKRRANVVAPTRRPRGRPPKVRQRCENLELLYCFPPNHPPSARTDGPAVECSPARELYLVCAAGRDLLLGGDRDAGALSAWIPSRAAEYARATQRQWRPEELRERYMRERDTASGGLEPLVLALAGATEGPLDDWVVEGCWDHVLAFCVTVGDRPGETLSSTYAIDGAILLRVAEHLDTAWNGVYAHASSDHALYVQALLIHLYATGLMPSQGSVLNALCKVTFPGPRKGREGEWRDRKERKGWDDPTFDGAFAAVTGLDPEQFENHKDRLRRIWNDDLTPSRADDPDDPELRRLRRMGPSDRTNRWTYGWFLLSRIADDEQRRAARSRLCGRLGITWTRCLHFVDRLPRQQREAACRRLSDSLGVTEPADVLAQPSPRISARKPAHA